MILRQTICTCGIILFYEHAYSYCDSCVQLFTHLAMPLPIYEINDDDNALSMILVFFLPISPLIILIHKKYS